MPARQQVELHGHTVTYHRMGEGPTVVLVHGITSSSRTWKAVMPRLAESHDVIAPDLLGHGRSAKPRGDYSLGGYASGIRDLMALLGVDSATVVGHSLGGGVAMQFAYQFPERLERLVLVDSGGLGNEVSPVLRAASLPGSEFVIPLLFSPPVRWSGAQLRGLLARFGLRGSADVAGMLEGMDSLGNRDARRAFVHTVRSVIDPRGQRVDARDRLYLSKEVPVLLLWGGRDRIIPAAHGREAQRLMPGSRLEILPDGGHFPYNDDPEWFVEQIERFVGSTEPARIDQRQVGERLREGAGG